MRNVEINNTFRASWNWMMTFQFFVSVYAASFFLPRLGVVFPSNLFLISRVDLKHASIESLFEAVEEGNRASLAAILTKWLNKLITKFDEIQPNILIKYCSFIHQFCDFQVGPWQLRIRRVICLRSGCRHRWNSDTAITTAASTAPRKQQKQ